jgi:hypothetical protein
VVPPVQVLAADPGNFAASPLDDLKLFQPRPRGVRATPIVLSIAFLTVAAAGAWATNSVIMPLFAPAVEMDYPLPEWTAAPGYETDPPADLDSTAEDTPVLPVRPIISRALVADPYGDGERGENAIYAVDGDPSTFWYTYAYASTDFGGLKPGVGFVIRLEQAADIHAVRLYSYGDGGEVEIRATDESDPGGGVLLGTGEFGHEAIIEFDNVHNTDVISLWITGLPRLPDGSYRLQLREVTIH